MPYTDKDTYKGISEWVADWLTNETALLPNEDDVSTIKNLGILLWMMNKLGKPKSARILYLVIERIRKDNNYQI